MLLLNRLPPAQDDPKAEIMEPLRIPGITYHDMGLVGREFDHWIVSQLSWRNWLYGACRVLSKAAIKRHYDLIANAAAGADTFYYFISSATALMLSVSLVERS